MLMAALEPSPGPGADETQAVWAPGHHGLRSQLEPRHPRLLSDTRHSAGARPHVHRSRHAVEPAGDLVNETFARRMFPAGDAIVHRIRSWRDENLLREIVESLPMSATTVWATPTARSCTCRIGRTPGGLWWSRRERRAIPRTSRERCARRWRELIRTWPWAGWARLRSSHERRSRGSDSVRRCLAHSPHCPSSSRRWGFTAMAYVVARRSRELGLRATLGASPRALFAQVAGRGLVSRRSVARSAWRARWPPAGSSRVSSSILLPPIR